jgi:hypothetical protein
LQTRSMKRWKDVLVHLLILGAVLSILPILFSFFPKPAFDEVLRREYPDEIALPYEAESRFGGERTYSQRSYVLVPSVFYDPKVVRVIQHNEEPPTVEEQRGIAYFSLGLVLAMGIAYFRERWQAQADED